MNIFFKSYRETLSIYDYAIFAKSIKKISEGKFIHGNTQPTIFKAEFEKNKFELWANTRKKGLRPSIKGSFNAQKNTVDIIVKEDKYSLIYLIVVQNISLLATFLITKDFVLSIQVCFYFSIGLFLIALVFFHLEFYSVKKSIRFLRNLEGTKQ